MIELQRFQFSLRFLFAAVLCSTIYATPFLHWPYDPWAIIDWLHLLQVVSLFIGLVYCEKPHQAMCWVLSAEYLSFIELVWSYFHCFAITGHDYQTAVLANVRKVQVAYVPGAVVVSGIAIFMLSIGGPDSRFKRRLWPLALAPVIGVACFTYFLTRVLMWVH